MRKKFENLEKGYNKTLKKFSKVFGLDLKYFIGGGFWFLLSHVTVFAKGLLLSILFANFLTKEVYGQYTFILSMLAIAAAFALPGLKPALVQAISRKFDGEYKAVLKQTFIWSTLGSAFLICVAIYGYLQQRELGTMIFLFLALAFPLFNTSQYFKTFFTGKEMYKKLSIMNCIFNIISTIAIATCVILKLNLFFILFATVVSQILINGYFTFFLTKRYIKNDKRDEKNLVYGKKLSFSLGFATFINQLENVIIIWFLGFEALAIYAIISIIPNQFKSLFGVVSPMFIPKLSKTSIGKKDLMKQVGKIFVISLVMVIGYIIISPFIFKFLYAPYQDYTWLSILFSLSIIFILPYLLLEEYFKAKLRNEMNYLYTVPPIVDIISIVILINMFGLLGVVISRIIYRLFLLLYGIYLFLRK